MTENKPIMIDGVDVLKEKINMCFILLLNKLETSETIEQTIYEHLDAFVDDWDKQLARKTQECEELKREIAFGNNGALSDKIRAEVFKELNNENDQLKAENEQLKKQIESDKGLITNAGKQNYQLIQEYDRLKSENEELKSCIECNPEAKVYKTNLDLFKTDTRVVLKLYSKAEQKLKRIEEYCKEQNLKADYTACEILKIIEEVE